MGCIYCSCRKHICHEDGAYLESSIGDMVWGRKTVPNNTEPVRNVTAGSTYFNMSCDSLKLDGSKDVWCLAVDQLWLEFLGVPRSKGRPVPFVESFPVTAWIAMPLLASQAKNHGCDRNEASQNGMPSIGDSHRPHDSTYEHCPSTHTEQSGNNQQQICDNRSPRGASESVANHNHVSALEQKAAPQKTKPSLADIHVMVKIGAKVSCQLNHYQYLFLMRLTESLSRTSLEIQEDTVNILGQTPQSKTISLAVKLSEAELAIMFPPTPLPTTLLGGSQTDSIQDIQEPTLDDQDVNATSVAMTIESTVSKESDPAGTVLLIKYFV